MRSFVALLAMGLGACGSPSDPTGSGHAWVQGVVSQVSGLPLANSTVRVACGRHGARVAVATDTAGHYITELWVDEASLDADGRAACQFSAPDAADPRVQLDTILGFARFTQFPPLQVVDLRERPEL
jgi:hypothetical protein